MTQTEALKLALEALEEIHVGNMTPMAETNWNKAITAIKEALAQPEHGPNLAEAYRTELDKLSQRNYELRMENAKLKQPKEPEQEPTYTSTQATKCAGCGEHKHTPLRIDAMGGYVCLTCINKKLGSLLGEFGYAQPEQEPWECVCGANLYIDSNGIPKSKASVEPATVMFKPEQEPVVWMKKMFSPELGEFFDYKDGAFARETDCQGWTPLYTTPPQRTWVGLTLEDKEEYVAQDFGGNRLDAMDWAEKRLKEKNT